MKRFGWKRLSPPRNKIVAHWVHAMGWEVRHCGHMTAIRPYFARTPGDKSVMVLDANGLGFGTLEKAFVAVERVIIGDLVLWYDPVPGRYGDHARIATKEQSKKLDRLARALHPSVTHRPRRRRNK